MEGLTRCRICGEIYFGKHPSHCPFCGAHEKYLVKAEVWKEENIGVTISDKTRENLKKAQELEYTNTRFYRASAKSKNPEIAGYFKYLSKIEAEHYSVITKLLSEEKEQTILEPSEDKGSDVENLKYSEVRETMASNLYKEFAASTPEPRVKEVFEALSEIENDHLRLDDAELKKLMVQK